MVQNKYASILGGLVTRRERWGLSGRGWLAILVGGGLFVVLWVLNVQPFLAPTERSGATILVVEGWVQDYAVRAAVAEFKAGGYQKIYTTGGPVTGTDGATNVFNTYASVGADLLLKAGLPPERVQMVPAPGVGRDRTYTSAVALRDWLRVHQVAAPSIDVLTEDAHARRTRLLFQDAFGSATKVGIISVKDPDYDAARWWRYSEGVREVLGESIAYLYARFLFHPGNPPVQVP